MLRHWDQFYMQHAKQVALQSSCIRRKVGAVLVKDNRIIATGYNGTLPGACECNEHFSNSIPDRSQHKTWSAQHEIHAEQNVLLDVMCRGTWVPNMHLYITCLPCATCALSLISAKIHSIYYTGEHAQDTSALDMFEAFNVEVYTI